MDFSTKAIGERVKRLREARNLTQKELALKIAEVTNSALCPSVSAISRWEKGGNGKSGRNIDAYELACIASALESSTDYLIFEVGTANLSTARKTGLSDCTINYLNDDFLGAYTSYAIDLLVKECPAIFNEIATYIEGVDGEIYTKDFLSGGFVKRTVHEKVVHELEILEILRETRREVCGK